MLDPIKVSVVTPGVNTDGTFAEHGIPAALVTAYLDHRGTEVEKTTDFTILFLFSMGITKGKWGTLVNALLNFKNDYDTNSPLVDVLPELVATHPDHYHGLGLRDLADEMFEQMKRSDQLELLAEAFSHLPQPVLTPNQTYQRLVHDEVEQVPLMVCISAICELCKLGIGFSLVSSMKIMELRTSMECTLSTV